MDDKKEADPTEAREPPDKPSTIAEGVSNLVGSATHLVKETASVIVDHIKTPTEVSSRVETDAPPVEENSDAPPMTADELAEQAAADNQPVKPNETVVMVPAMDPGLTGTLGMPPAYVVAPEPRKSRPKKKAPSKSITNRLTNILFGADQSPARKKPTTKKVAAKRVAKKAAKKSTSKKAEKNSKKAATKKRVKKSAKKARTKTTTKAGKSAAKKQRAKKSVKKKKNK